MPTCKVVISSRPALAAGLPLPSCRRCRQAPASVAAAAAAAASKHYQLPRLPSKPARCKPLLPAAGSSTGIGHGILKQLAAGGATTVMHGLVEEGQLRKQADQVAQQYGTVVGTSTANLMNPQEIR